MNVLNKQMLLHKNLICSKKNNVYLTYNKKSVVAIISLKRKIDLATKVKKKMVGKLNYILH
jgi:hypothetical protein